VDIGRGLSALGVADDAQRVLGAGACLITHIGHEGQALVLALPLGPEIDGDKGRIIDGDADLLDRGDQKILAPLALEDGREQPYQCRAAYGRALIEPCAVARDPHVQITAKGRVPQMHRRQPLARAGGRCRLGQGIGRRCHAILFACGFCHWTLMRYVSH